MVSLTSIIDKFCYIMYHGFTLQLHPSKWSRITHSKLFIINLHFLFVDLTMETKCTKLKSMQTIGNLVWQVQHNTPTLDNSPNGIVSCTISTIARTEKLVVFLTKSHMYGMSLGPNEVVEKGHLINACSNCISQTTTLKHKASVEPPLKKMKLLGNALKDLNEKFIKPTSPTMDESNKFIDSSCCLLILNN